MLSRHAARGRNAGRVGAGPLAARVDSRAIVLGRHEGSRQVQRLGTAAVCFAAVAEAGNELAAVLHERNATIEAPASSTSPGEGRCR